MEMQIKNLKVKDLIPYEKNTKKHDKTQIKNVAESIKQYGFVQPLVVDKDNVVVIGHCRLLAAKRLKMDEVPCVSVDDLTPEQVNALRIVDNKTNESEWDFDFLADELQAVDLSDFEFDFDIDLDEEEEEEQEEHGTLIDQFGVPPFSVLDTRQGYWQDRKKYWLEKTGNLSQTRDEEFGRLSSSSENLLDKINGGTSNFDPVLAELAMKWFGKRDATILDPFGGEQTKGVVAGELGFEYYAVEFRQEQVDLNNKICEKYKNVHYFCGDSNNISKIINKRGFDLLFTSPPYYDLEVYSKDDMSALGSYKEFMEQYNNIFAQCYDMLAEDAFFVIKIGEIRNKKTGQYRCFVADNIKMFEKIGFKFYNDIVLVNSCGTAPVRAKRSMNTRKIVKVHQNVLVFYKGKLSNISKIYGDIDFGGINYECIDD